MGYRLTNEIINNSEVFVALGITKEIRNREDELKKMNESAE